MLLSKTEGAGHCDTELDRRSRKRLSPQEVCRLANCSWQPLLTQSSKQFFQKRWYPVEKLDVKLNVKLNLQSEVKPEIRPEVKRLL